MVNDGINVPIVDGMFLSMEYVLFTPILGYYYYFLSLSLSFHLSTVIFNFSLSIATSNFKYRIESDDVK